jgi:hypothetical protein
MDWWLVIAIAAVVIVATRVLKARGGSAAPTSESAAGTRVDFSGNREASRVSGLSEEDRAWETASQQRSRDAAVRDGDSSGTAG